MREIKIKELFTTDEVFLSASNKEVMPVIMIDDKVVGNGKPGEITKKIMSEFRKFIDSGKW
ncbi:hypothetical protein A2863_01785 [Candidatus Woesebacteria bacterium RIFCSPHIGHO2_01_FULL_38_9b]|nr:MAG: hypothetical protein A2863_01785 [Candidatus Woesebacteria bacterium RIFCSPHIGHO2_01_FULL_38_9b]